MKTFNNFRVTLNEYAAFMTVPAQGQADQYGRPCVYMTKSTGPTVTPVSENFGNDQFSQWEKGSDNHQDIPTLSKKLHSDQGTGAFDSLNKNHRLLRSYSDESEPLNRALYERHIAGNPVTNRQPIDDAVEQHKLHDDLHTYSGTHFNPGEIASQHPDNIVHLPAFTSTSLNRGVAASFSRSQGEVNGMSQHHVIHFNLKAGQKGAFVGHNSNVGEHEQISWMPHEAEHILPRNTTVHIHPKPTTITDHANNRQYHVWEAHVLDNN